MRGGPETSLCLELIAVVHPDEALVSSCLARREVPTDHSGWLLLIIWFGLSALALLAAALVFYASGKVSAPLLFFGVAASAFGFYARHLSRKRED